MDRKLWVNKAPAILTPTRELELALPGPRLEGRYEVQLIRKGKVIKELKFKNLVTNAGLDLLSAGGSTVNSSLSAAFNYLSVGTGNAAPAAADVSLQAPLAPRVNRTGGQIDIAGADGTGKFTYLRRVRLFLETEVNGNLAELGFYTLLTGGVLVNRQLFRDDLGNAVVITKTNQDQLKVTFEWRLYYPTANVTGTINMGGTNYDYVIQADGGLDGSHWGGSTGGSNAASNLGGVGAGPASMAYQTLTLAADPGLLSNKSGLSAGANTDTLAAYVNGTFYRDETAIWDPGSANFGAGGIAGLTSFEQGSIGGGVYHGNLFVIKFTPNIPKIATQRLTINTRRSWGRYP